MVSCSVAFRILERWFFTHSVTSVTQKLYLKHNTYKLFMTVNSLHEFIKVHASKARKTELLCCGQKSRARVLLAARASITVRFRIGPVWIALDTAEDRRLKPCRSSAAQSDRACRSYGRKSAVASNVELLPCLMQFLGILAGTFELDTAKDRRLKRA